MKLLVSISLLVSSSLCLARPVKPKLLVIFVVDQMRADYLERFHSFYIPEGQNKSEGGFRWLEANGASFTEAKHLTLSAMTCPGHATIVTGTTPSRHGISKNSWWDPQVNSSVYCVEDSLSKDKLTNEPSATPRRLLAPTIGDELKSVSPTSKIYSIALKDRSSVMLGGKRADLALWIDSKKMAWTSSDWYLPVTNLPKWVAEENQKIEQSKGEVFDWRPTIKGYAKQPSLGFLGDLPMQFPKKDESSLGSPYGIELTQRMALLALDKIGLGKGEVPDILAVSFSTTDYVGHQFGPTHLATAEIFKSADLAISNIIKAVLKDRKREDVVFALSADHGIPPVPETAAKSLQFGSRLKGSDVVEDLEIAISKQFGKPKGSAWIADRGEFHFFLANSIPNDLKLKVSNFAKSYLNSKDWVDNAFTKEEVVNNHITDPYLKTQINATFSPNLLPDFGVVIKPYSTAGSNTVTHMTGFNYDTNVPLIIVGSEIQPGKYRNEAFVYDLAPTLSYLLGLNPPAKATGKVLDVAIKESR
jgi:predicted AlkP superfamily pyrophosphatase or phosphodiesterase